MRKDGVRQHLNTGHFEWKNMAVKVISEEGGSTVTDRGVRIYTGPGTNYSVIGWTGLDQVLVADATAESTIPGDSINDRLWYRIHLPNRLGSSYGWVASEKSDGTLLVRHEPLATIVEVINDDGVGWRLRRQGTLAACGCA